MDREEAFRTGVNAYIEQVQVLERAAEDFWGTLTATARETGRSGDGRLRQPAGRAARRRRHSVQRRRSGREDRAGRLKAPTGGGSSKPGSTAPRWTIPVCVKTPARAHSCDVVNAAPARPLDACSSVGHGECGARGYYRVVYPPGMLGALAREVSSLAPAERIALSPTNGRSFAPAGTTSARSSISRQGSRPSGSPRS